MSGKIYDGPAFTAQLNGFVKSLDEKIKKVNKLKVSYKQVIDNTSLEGKAYNSYKEYLQRVIMPYLDLNIKYFEAYKTGCEKFPSDFKKHNSLLESTEYVDTTSLQNYVNITNHRREKLVGLISVGASTLNISEVESVYSTTNNQKIINELEAYDPISKNVFEDADYYYSLLNKSNTVLTKTNKNQNYDVKGNGLLGIFDEIAFIIKYDIKGLDPQQLEKVSSTLADEERQLIKDGWSEKAIKAYFKAVLDNKSKVSVEELNESFKGTKKVGSKEFVILFDNTEGYREKVEITLNLMGAPDTEHLTDCMLLDKNGYKFDENLNPADPFFTKFSDAVIKGYDPKSKEYQRVSQFRMYIDKHNIEYVRREGKPADATDYEKLLNLYGKDIVYSKTSRLHNRNVNQDGEQVNDKLLLNNGHCEFIIDTRTGNFNTQWDVICDKKGNIRTDKKYYENLTVEQKLEMVNTESFNYGNPDNKSVHEEFDVSPVAEDNTNKNEWKIKQNLKNKYPSTPSLSSFNESLEDLYHSDRSIQDTYSKPEDYRKYLIKEYGENISFDDYYQEKIKEKDYKEFLKKWRNQK